MGIKWYVQDQISMSVRIQICLIPKHQPSPPCNIVSEDGRKGRLRRKGGAFSPHAIKELFRYTCDDQQMLHTRLQCKAENWGVTAHRWWWKLSEWMKPWSQSMWEETSITPELNFNSKGWVKEGNCTKEIEDRKAAGKPEAWTIPSRSQGLLRRREWISCIRHNKDFQSNKDYSTSTGFDKYILVSTRSTNIGNAESIA